MWFSLERPEAAETHLIVEVPHAGLLVPPGLDLPVSEAQRLRDADLFVDELFSGAPRAGASLLVARLSRYVVDLNRAADDVDASIVKDHPAPRPKQSRGVIWRSTTDGTPVLSAPLDYGAFEARIAQYYEPYHEALRAEVERKKALFGKVLVVCAHSMPSRGRPQGPRRADVVPGSQNGSTTSGAVLRAVETHFRAAGLSVAHDDPYKGGYTTQRYGLPHRDMHAIQIELNRALYVDEASSTRDAQAIDHLQGLVENLLGKLARVPLP